jgi:hypothetical protein
VLLIKAHWKSAAAHALDRDFSFPVYRVEGNSTFLLLEARQLPARIVQAARPFAKPERSRLRFISDILQFMLAQHELPVVFRRASESDRQSRSGLSGLDG